MKYVPVDKTDPKWFWRTPLKRVVRHWKIFAMIAMFLAAFLVLPWTGRDPLLRFQHGMAAAKNGDTETVLHEASLLLKTTGFANRAGGGEVTSTFEKTARSVAS